MTTRIGVMTVRLMGPPIGESETPEQFDVRNQDTVDRWTAVLNEAVSEVSDVLPEGFYCKVDEA